MRIKLRFYLTQEKETTRFIFARVLRLDMRLLCNLKVKKISLLLKLQRALFNK